jgi:hypothetical protein
VIDIVTRPLWLALVSGEAHTRGDWASQPSNNNELGTRISNASFRAALKIVENQCHSPSLSHCIARIRVLYPYLPLLPPAEPHEQEAASEMRRSSPYSKVDKPSKKGSSDKGPSSPINWWSLLQIITVINFVVVGYFIWNRNSSSSSSSRSGVEPAIAATATSSDTNSASAFASTLVHNIQDNVASLQSNVVDRYHQLSEGSTSVAHGATAGAVAGAFASSGAPATPAPPAPTVAQQTVRPELPACLDPEWCNIQMPSVRD